MFRKAFLILRDHVIANIHPKKEFLKRFLYSAKKTNFFKITYNLPKKLSSSKFLTFIRKATPFKTKIFVNSLGIEKFSFSAAN